VGELKIEIGQLGHFPFAEKENPSPEFALHTLKFTEEKLLDITVKIDGITEVLRRETAFPGQALGGEKIFEPVARHGFDLEIALADQALEECVDKPHRDVETLGKFPLARVAVPIQLPHEPEHVKIMFVHPDPIHSAIGKADYVQDLNTCQHKRR